VFHIVDCFGGRTSQYISVEYSTYKKAVEERDDLLRVYPPGHIWRERICIRHPDGKITNPDKEKK